MNKDSTIYVAGATGLVGSAIVRQLKDYNNVSTVRVDLLDKDQVERFFDKYHPDYIFMCAAHAGGLPEAINHPYPMIYDNLLMGLNIIDIAKRMGSKLMYFGSSCMYPVNSEQPYIEEQLGEGKTDSNWGYAVAKLACYEMARLSGFITVVPCNVYGPNDNFDLTRCHVIPALIKKFETAKTTGTQTVEVWGSGEARREFIYSDDLASCCELVMNEFDGDVINIGWGIDVSIRELVSIVVDVVGYKGKTVFNVHRPTGVHSKLMSVGRADALGWKPNTGLVQGIKKTYEWYLSHT